MATYYSDSNQPGNMMLYMNSGPYTDTMGGGNSEQQNDCVNMSSVEGMDSMPQQQEILSGFGGGSRIGEHGFNLWRDNGNEMLLMQNLQGHGLSLSLGTQIPLGIQMPSTAYRSPDPRLVSFSSPNPSISGEGRNADLMSIGFGGGNQDFSRRDSSYGVSNIARSISNSGYLKPAQQLLDEVVNISKALKHPDDLNDQNRKESHQKISKEGDRESKNDALSNTQESAGNSSELSQAERQDLQNKLAKLSSMLDEVDKRYRQYYHQMQIVMQSFDAIAGYGSAKPYTALALQRISRHFRCLRDAITGQVQATRNSLGEQETPGIGISRLRHVDQHLRQQRAIQQLGVMQQHTWRPQRGLPESSVTILRAWLFEHFLHPYPKDSDKIILARQTGLSRGQVSNWFINARVRLWKPMVEDMYKEEIGDTEMGSHWSSENAVEPLKVDVKSDKGEDFQQSASPTAGQFLDSKSNLTSELGVRTGDSFLDGTHKGVEIEYNAKLREMPNVNDRIIFPDTILRSDDASNNRFLPVYHMSELDKIGGRGGTGVSLTLGLQHCVDGSLPMSGGMHHGMVTMRGDGFYDAEASSIEAETMEFESLNRGNQQQRVTSSHPLLHDFVG